MKDLKISLNKHCTCTQPQCPIWGNCVLCVQNHLEHKRHIPECIQDILRPAVFDLCQQMELNATEARPKPLSWKNFDRKDHIKKSKERHCK